MTATGTLPDVRLREAREQQGMSQAELAVAAGVTPSTVHRLETIKGRRAQPKVARRIAEALGLTTEDVDELRVTYRPTGGRLAPPDNDVISQD